MFILGNFFIALGRVVDIVLWIYMWIVIIRALISWVNPDPNNPIVVFLRATTDPFLNWIRRVLRLPPYGIDFSPLIAILIIYFARLFLVKTLIQIGVRLS